MNTAQLTDIASVPMRAIVRKAVHALTPTFCVKVSAVVQTTVPESSQAVLV